jgi:hypothetical protein
MMNKSELFAPCEYCGTGRHTGLPGNACENCMNTGYKHPKEALEAIKKIKEKHSVDITARMAT